MDATEKLRIFKSLFKGREDVFALRWEKNGKHGYMPACSPDWDAYRLHKAKGGTWTEFPHKNYDRLTDARIINHLAGKEIIGIYPLLPNGSSWFIAADFDQGESKSKVWLVECRRFMQECAKHGLPVCLERSRSGQGGHVWMFFEKPYPAVKSRALFVQLLTDAGIITGKDKTTNFDRLFPNQDFLTGQMLGNLISLPLQKQALDIGNACFIDAGTAIPFADQWGFLEGIVKVNIETLEAVCAALLPVQKNATPSLLPANTSYDVFTIILSNQITMPRAVMHPLVLKYLKDQYNFRNSKSYEKGHGARRLVPELYFKMVEEKEDAFIMPRGLMKDLLQFCASHKITYKLIDQRIKLEEVSFDTSIPLFNYQQAAIDAVLKKDFGVIVAPPGSGKTIIALDIISRRQQPALVIVHRRQRYPGEQTHRMDESIAQIPAGLPIEHYAQRHARRHARRCARAGRAHHRQGCPESL